MNKVFLRIVIISFFIFFHIEMEAQDTGAYGSYSPYTMFGIGDLSKQGTSFNKSMGGVGIATRNRRYVNYLNPASLTARDSLSFMADFGISQNNKIYRQGDMISGNNTFNIYNFVISFPIYRSSAFMIGITPYSDVGYDFSSVETDQDIIGSTGNITHNYYGEGGIYQFFFGGGVTFLFPPIGQTFFPPAHLILSKAISFSSRCKGGPSTAYCCRMVRPCFLHLHIDIYLSVSILSHRRLSM